MIRKPRSVQRISNIEMSAFAGILVVLLGLFAIPGGITVGVLDQHRIIPVDLVKVKRPTSLPHVLREDAVIVSVTRDGSIFFGTDRILPELLTPKIRESISRGAERRIYINADKRANYRDVKKAIDAIRTSGVEQISILAAPSDLGSSF
jgi:biopolymer transport protein TolR